MSGKVTGNQRASKALGISGLLHLLFGKIFNHKYRKTIVLAIFPVEKSKASVVEGSK
jgi:hypothetical protein